MHYTSPVDVLLAYFRENEVLLALRANTGYADGMWNLPSGKLEAGEDVVTAMRRETREEIDLALAPDELGRVAVVHVRSPEGQARVGVVFAVDAAPERHGLPRNAEPHKCAGLQWFPLDALPPTLFEYSRAGIRAHLDGRPLVLAGWQD